MRVWSLHPKYLDAKGLVALWRETLLAKNVLEGNTKGYKNHPQLIRFKESDSPVDAINQYLAAVYMEAIDRNYNFDKQKVDWNFKKNQLNVTDGQMNYEVTHLMNKLKTRDMAKFDQLKNNLKFDCHPLFTVVKGEVEHWEILTDLPTLNKIKKME